MTKTTKSKMLSFLLCFVMIATTFCQTAMTVWAEETNSNANSQMTITKDGKEVSEVAIEKDATKKDDKTTLKVTGNDSKDIQWQYYAKDYKAWINIYGENSDECTLTYAKVCNMLDDNNQTKIRCTVKDSKPAVNSNAVTLTINENKTSVENSTDNGNAENTTNKSGIKKSPARAAAETYTIVINYQFADGSQAASPWTGTVAAGSSFKETIKSPTVVGYTPDKAEVVFDIDKAEANVTETVTYNAAEVKYTVKHFKQNLNDDKYELAETETKTGFTKNPVGGELAKSYEGFYSLLYDTETEIAADDSTTVEVYYDRYYYLMSFDMDGGYGVEPVYAKYGTPISVGTPKKAGYTFDGWQQINDDGSTTDVNEIPSTMPAQNSKYKAKWKAGDSAKVTIIVWGENADDEEYSYYKNDEIQAKPGEELTIDTLQGKLVCGKEEHSHSDACGISCKHTSHDLTCYGLSANASETTPDDEAVKYFNQLVVEDGYIYRFEDSQGFIIKTGTKDHYYLRLNGKYYEYLSKPNDNLGNQNVKADCDNEGFGHIADSFYKYELNTICTHTHTDECYICDKETHKHSSACYYNTSFMENPELWKLVKSDTVTVAADGSTVMNVYYDRVEFTLHFRKARSNSDDYGTITKKWGAKIRDEFNAKGDQAGTRNWSENRDASGPWTSYLDIMPTEDRTYYAYSTTGSSTAYYYGEGLNGNDELMYESKASGRNLNVTEEEFIEFEGFTFNAERSTKKGESFNGAKFYYTRNSYDLTFRSDNKDVKTESLKYKAPMSGFKDYVPEYPSSLEPDAYVFGGWYTTAGLFDGTECDLSTETMPASNVILFAKWVPKTHTVKTHLTKATVTGAPMDTWTVSHGKTVENPPNDPVNGEYKFVGWFYEENGKEKAYDFSMPVNKDLDLYAKWSSNKLMPYIIHYQDEAGNTIAPDTRGSALAGTTKTFEAKTGDELNEGYRSGYFPRTNSHSLTISIDDPAENEFTFIYVKKPSVQYTVKYMELKQDGTTAPMKLADGTDYPDKVATTSDAVITEKYVQFNGFAPDAYQKRLVLSADESENVIIFYYVKDEVHAPVQIVHHIQNVEGEDYTIYSESTDLNGEIGKDYSASILDIEGFTYHHATANSVAVQAAGGKVTAKVTEDGLIIDLYYNRNLYPYEFRFLEQGTDKPIHDAKTGSARFGAQVTAAAEIIPGYDLVSAENQAINIRVENPADTAYNNVKIFYYQEKKATIEYKVVGPEGCGEVSNTKEILHAITGTAAGSAATASNDEYRFVGWYKDAECTQPVDEDGWISGNKITPQKTKDYDDSLLNKLMGYESATYYAKFEYNNNDLSITKEVSGTMDENQSFMFRVKGDSTDDRTKDIDVTVTIHGDGTVTVKDLPVGKYTVTELTEWSWRYTPDKTAKDITLKASGGNSLTFTNTREKTNWLNGSSWCRNVFKGNTIKSEKTTTPTGN